jgi:hypothetical protein
LAESQVMAHLHRDEIRSPVHIRRGEPQQAEPGPDKAVLAPIIFDHSVAVVAAVVLDREAPLWIDQVWPAQETIPIVMDRNLNFGPREPSKNEEHPQPSLHRRLGLRLGKTNHAPKPRNPFGSRMLVDISAQLVHRNQVGMKEHVRGHDPFRQRVPAADVNHRAESSRDRQTAPSHDFLASQRGAANGCAGAATAADWFVDGDLDRVARRQVQAM